MCVRLSAWVFCFQYFVYVCLPLFRTPESMKKQSTVVDYEEAEPNLVILDNEEAKKRSGPSEMQMTHEEDSPVTVKAGRRSNHIVYEDDEYVPPVISTRPELLMMDIGKGFSIPWFEEAEEDWYTFDGVRRWDVLHAVGIIRDILLCQLGTSTKFTLRATLQYNAYLSHSKKNDGTHRFLLELKSVANNFVPGESQIISIGVENSITDPLFWQLTSGNVHSRFPETPTRLFCVMMTLLRHFFRLLSWVNSIMPRVRDESILFLKSIRFYMENSREREFAHMCLLQAHPDGWKQVKPKSNWVHVELKDFTHKNRYRGP
jgi:hypothetical protein